MPALSPHRSRALPHQKCLYPSSFQSLPLLSSEKVTYFQSYVLVLSIFELDMNGIIVYTLLGFFPQYCAIYSCYCLRVQSTHCHIPLRNITQLILFPQSVIQGHLGYFCLGSNTAVNIPSHASPCFPSDTSQKAAPASPLLTLEKDPHFSVLNHPSTSIHIYG